MMTEAGKKYDLGTSLQFDRLEQTYGTRLGADRLFKPDIQTVSRCVQAPRWHIEADGFTSVLIEESFCLVLFVQPRKPPMSITDKLVELNSTVSPQFWLGDRVLDQFRPMLSKTVDHGLRVAPRYHWDNTGVANSKIRASVDRSEEHT